MAEPVVAVVTCAGAGTDADDVELLGGPLADRGIVAESVEWDDPDVVWGRFALSVLRSTWDYPSRHDQFLAWTAAVPRLANPAGVVAWNADKHYLLELAAAGVPVIPTVVLDPGTGRSAVDTALADAGRAWSEAGDVVVKPAIGAGSLDAGRFGAGDEMALAGAHVATLLDANRAALVQPYVPGIDADGETALVFIDGAFSHAVRKGPLLSGPPQAVDGWYVEEDISARQASAVELGVAEAALDAVPFGRDELLYARVDVVTAPDGPRLLELELIEPSLFLAHGDGAERLADAIASKVGSAAAKVVD